jgi:hypothetical protein
VSVELFRDDDHGYAAWLAANASGYVLNIQRALNPFDARMHHADCRTITGTPPCGKTWTGPYVRHARSRCRNWTPGRRHTPGQPSPDAAPASR